MTNNIDKVVGVDVGATNIKAGVVVNPPKVETFLEVGTQADNIVNQLVGITSELKADAVGVGIAGLVGSGIVYSSPNLPGIRNLKLKKLLEARLKIPVSVTNDANMVALGEWQYGAGKGMHNLLLLTLGTGVGGGIIIDDKLYTGVGFAGEVGHITIDPDGPPCRCGNYGCLESFVGSEAIVKRALQGIRVGVETLLTTQYPVEKYHEMTAEVISKVAYNGDAFARSIIEEIGKYLGIGIASLCAVLDPDMVVIGGGVSKAGEILFTKINEEVNKRLYLRKKVKILPASLGDYAGILGSAVYIKSKIKYVYR
ncbi:MAG: ROK family protein [bacterium]|nr:ROK family protein [bacterium]